MSEICELYSYSSCTSSLKFCQSRKRAKYNRFRIDDITLSHAHSNQPRQWPQCEGMFHLCCASLVLKGREGSLNMSVGLRSRIRGSLLRGVSYNPMSLIQSRGALDISEELSADLIGLQDTRSRVVPRPGVGDRYTVRRHPRH